MTEIDYSFLDGLGPDPHLSPTRNWHVNDQGFESYNREAYFPMIAGGLRGAIAARLGIRPYPEPLNERVGLDLAGGWNAQALVDLIAAGLLDRGLVTNDLDKRTKMVRQNTRIGHVEGDLRLPATCMKIKAWQQEHAPDGFDFIAHRPAGALQLLPGRVYAGGLNFLLAMLKPDRLLFAQMPMTTSLPCNARLGAMIRRHADVAEVVMSEDHPDPDIGRYSHANSYAIIIKR